MSFNTFKGVGNRMWHCNNIERYGYIRLVSNHVKVQILGLCMILIPRAPFTNMD